MERSSSSHSFRGNIFTVGVHIPELHKCTYFRIFSSRDGRAMKYFHLEIFIEDNMDNIFEIYFSPSAEASSASLYENLNGSILLINARKNEICTIPVYMIIHSKYLVSIDHHLKLDR